MMKRQDETHRQNVHISPISLKGPDMVNKIGINHFFKAILCAALLLGASAGTGRGQEPAGTKTIQAIGTARVYKDDVAGARDRAIRNGLATALDRAVMDSLPGESLIENFQAVNEILQGDTGAYIQGYQVLAEQRAGNTYRALVQAAIATAALEEQFSAAGILLGKKTLPKVLFLIAEQNIDDAAPRYWWGKDHPYFTPVAEYAVAGFMRKKGFVILDAGAVVQSETEGIDFDTPDPENAEAAAAGIRFGADLVILGKSSVATTANVMGADIRSFQATVSLRAIQTRSGTEIAATTQTAVAVQQSDLEGGTEALTKAGTLAGAAISRKIVSVWGTGLEGASTVKIVVEGTRNLVNFVLFRKMLNDISGVEGIKIREMRPDTSTIMVEYAGTPKLLADALMLKTVKNFGINITEVAEDHLRVEIVSK